MGKRNCFELLEDKMVGTSSLSEDLPNLSDALLGNKDLPFLPFLSIYTPSWGLNV